ncbi:MAG: glycosyltransferase family 4 protein [Candidatus Paceibacterota bacterium]
MKIAIIVRRLNVRGGTQRQAIELALRLQSSGNSVTLYTFKYEPKICFVSALHNLKVIELKTESRQPAGYLKNLCLEQKKAKELAKLIDQDTEILNPHDQLSYKVAYYFKKQVKNIPSIWMMNDMPTKWPSFLREREVNPNLKIGLLKHLAYKLFDYYDTHKFIKAQNRIVVLDNRDRDWVRQFFGQTAEVVRSGLDISGFIFKARTVVRGEQIKILTTSIFFPHRRFEDTIEAISILKSKGFNLKFQIVGDFDSDKVYADFTRRRIVELGLEHEVEIMGRVSDEELRFLYQSAHLFAFVSHMQSWGLAVFEAMATGLPIIVSETTGAAEVLIDKKRALFVPPKSPKAIAGAIELLVGDPKLYHDLASNGRQFVEQNISWEKYTAKMLEIFRSELKR